MDKDTSEITKLTERISKDPKSKLFVPLAEEYKKAGDMEMSIHVLTEGLKNNPGYVTARSFLGKLLFEKGDLSGAQKEFEEVAKAIPDNLMAQRKLGDLYILQDRAADALKHYKIALSLNPRDQETASLVADVEAGRDVKARLFKPKPQPVEDALKLEGSPKAVPAQAAPKPPQQPAPAAAKPPGAPPVAAEETEEPEEVLVVEPLEPAGPVSLEEALSSKGLDFLSESAPGPAPADSAEDGRALFGHEDPFAVQRTAGDTHVAEETSLEAREGETPASLAGEPGKQADDFTTDTLAELYISQGFFEKAVDIYERMLVDNPKSQGLKNKLANVRAMAAETAPAAEPEAEARSFAVPEQHVTRTAPPEIPAAEMAPGFFDEYVPPPSREIEQSQPGGQRSSPAQLPEREKKTSGPASAQPKQFDAGFEPSEHVPPSAPPQQQAAEEAFGKTADEKLTAEKTGTNITRPRKSLVTGRKETIDRLENWLQHIMKEK
jgi:tetratricopeptide (TPR) repeat protein